MREVLKCVEMRGGLQNFETELLPPSLLFAKRIKDRTMPGPRSSHACLYFLAARSLHTYFSVCVCVCVCFSEDIFIAFYKRVPSAAIQSPPPPLGFSTPNIMSFILSVKIID